MRIGPLARLLVASLATVTALETQPAALLRIDQEKFPDEVYKPECHACCPITIRTVFTTIISTIFQDRTQYVTATERDISNYVKYITQFVTTTAINTYASSYPVTVTRTVDCYGYMQKRSDSEAEDDSSDIQRLEGRTDNCHTTTVTEWVTTTATRVVTGIESIIQTQMWPVTVPVPTTVHNTRTVIGSTTIWVPTTYVRTTTVISEKPVTRTVDNTIYTTKSTTVYTTLVSTVATSYPVVSYITRSLTQTVTAPGQLTTVTKPAETITKPGETITKPAETVTKPGETVTKPAETVTKPGETITKPADTVTRPAETVTKPGETITKPADTVTRPAETVTKPAQTITQPGKTVTLPPHLSTITLPGHTRTLPGSTVVSTLTKTLPPTTVKVTQDQITKTVIQPGTTVTERQTQTLPPIVITKPASTVTVTPVFNVTVCPSPTGSSAPLSPQSNLTFGCKPGFVCNPPKPNGCNMWPGPPSDDYLCDPNYCMPSPPFTNTTWDQCKTQYYPPSYGYFNLNPEAFGLSYDIFEYKLYQKVIDGHTTTVTTGNWESQASLTAWPKPSPTWKSASPFIRARAEKVNELKGCHRKRAITPSMCFDDCNNAYVTAEAQGKTQSLCADGSPFRVAYGLCANCIKANSNSTAKTIIDYVGPQFMQYINFCSGLKAGKPSTTSPDQIQSMVSTLPPIRTSTQVDTSGPGFTAVKPSTTVSSEAPVQASSLPPVVSSKTDDSKPSTETTSTETNGTSTVRSTDASSTDSALSSSNGTNGQSSAQNTAGASTLTSDAPHSKTQGDTTGHNQASSTGPDISTENSAKGTHRTQDPGASSAGSPSSTAGQSNAQITGPSNTLGQSATSSSIVAVTAAADRVLMPGSLVSFILMGTMIVINAI